MIQRQATAKAVHIYKKSDIEYEDLNFNWKRAIWC